MPKRRRRAKWSTQKRPLDFAESPLMNGRHDLPTPVHCSLYPTVTADIVPVEQIATSWVSPQFEGKLLRGETIGRRVRRRPPVVHTRALSIDSSSSSATHGRFTNADQGTRPRLRRRPTFRPLKFVLNESSEVARKSSEDESTTSDGECDRVAEVDAQQTRRRSAPLERSQGENEEAEDNESIGNSFADIISIGKHLNVRTPDDVSQMNKDLPPPSDTDHETTSSPSAEDATSKRNLSRRLFQQTTNEVDCGEVLTGADERLPSSENVSERDSMLEVNTQVAPPKAIDVSLSHLSFESKDDSMFVGCLPHVNLLDGSAFLQPDSSLSQNDTLDISKTEMVQAKKSHDPLNTGAKTTVPACKPFLWLPSQTLSLITQETPPKEFNILVKETPVSYHGLTYRQKQLKGFF